MEDLDGVEVVEMRLWGGLNPVRHLLVPSSNAADYGSPFEPFGVLIDRAERMAVQLWQAER